MDEISEKLRQIILYNVNNGILNLDSEGWKKWVKIRESFLHKVESIIISKIYLENYVKSINKKRIDIDSNMNKEIMKQLYDSSRISTYFLENMLYHMLSSLDCLAKIIPYFYKDLQATNTLHKMYNSIYKQKEEKFKRKEILNFIENKENHWLINKEGQGLYNYRAEIYHNISKMCDTSHIVTFKANEAISELIINTPEKLVKIKGHNKEVKISEFTELLWGDYKQYILALFNTIELDITGLKYVTKEFHEKNIKGAN